MQDRAVCYATISCMTAPASLIRSIRLLHLYTGLFIAPGVLFFAFTGALQTVPLHESSKGSSYQPPHWIVTLAQLHKKQTTVLPVRRAVPAAAPVSGERIPEKAQSAPPAKQKAPDTRPMKAYFLLVSAGLCLSTATGIYMAYKFTRNKRAVAGTLVAGVVIPILLLFATR